MGRRPCPPCPAVCTVRPHGVWRSRQRRPEGARAARWATQGGRRWAWGAVRWQSAPMARSRLGGALRHQGLGAGLPRGGLPLPRARLAEATHRHGLPPTVSLPTVGRGRVIGPLGSPEEARAAACPPSSRGGPRAASPPAPGSRVRGGLPEGWDSPTHRRRTRWPGARRGNGLGHALTPLPPPRAALPSPLRQAWHAHCHPLRHRARQRKGGRVLARGQRLRPVADRGTAPAGTANGERGRRGCQATQAGGEAVREAPQRPATSTLVAPAHHALERTGGARPGVPQPGGRQQAWRTGLAPLYTLGPSQRRAQHAGPGGVEVEGGNVPTQEWFLNRQRRTSGGLR